MKHLAGSQNMYICIIESNMFIEKLLACTRLLPTQLLVVSSVTFRNIHERHSLAAEYFVFDIEW